MQCRDGNCEERHGAPVDSDSKTKLDPSNLMALPGALQGKGDALLAGVNRPRLIGFRCVRQALRSPGEGLMQPVRIIIHSVRL